MSHPLLAGLETVRPLGTANFCGEIMLLREPFIQAMERSSTVHLTLKLRIIIPNLSVGVLNVVVHNNHEENGNRHAKVTNQTSDLVGTDH